MKKVGQAGWILVVIMFIVAGAGVGINYAIGHVLGDSHEEQTSQSVENSKTPEESVENAPVTEVDTSSVYPGLDLESRTEETDAYTLSISRVYTESDELNRRLTDWVKDQEKKFKAAIDVDKNHSLRSHFNVQVDTYQVAEELYALTFESYSIKTGQANGINEAETFLLDLEQMKIIELEDIIKTEKSSLNELKDLISQQLESDFAESDDVLFEDYAEEAISDSNEWTWSLTEEEFVLFFDEYEVAPGSAGAVKVALPIEEIKPYMQEALADRIGVRLPDDSEKRDETNQDSHDSNEESSANNDQENSEPQKEPETEGKYVALTFDDGPDPHVTPSILEHLKAYNAEATFFALGSQAEYYPDLVKAITDSGHEMANHTMNHIDLSVTGEAEVRAEIAEAEQSIQAGTDDPVQLFRPPYGATNDTINKIIAEKGYTSVHWSVDSLDWKTKDADSIYNKVMAETEPGSIILMHDIHEATAEALPRILDDLSEEGYQFLTVSELMKQADQSGPGPIYQVQ